MRFVRFCREYFHSSRSLRQLKSAASLKVNSADFLLGSKYIDEGIRRILIEHGI